MNVLDFCRVPVLSFVLLRKCQIIGSGETIWHCGGIAKCLPSFGLSSKASYFANIEKLNVFRYGPSAEKLSHQAAYVFCSQHMLKSWQNGTIVGQYQILADSRHRGTMEAGHVDKAVISILV